MYYIYFIQVDHEPRGPIKIGRALHPQSRLKTFQAWTPYPLRVLATVREDVSICTEGDLHRKFADYRMHGEWFRADPVLLDYIRRLKK